MFAVCVFVFFLNYYCSVVFCHTKTGKQVNDNQPFNIWTGWCVIHMDIKFNKSLLFQSFLGIFKWLLLAHSGTLLLENIFSSQIRLLCFCAITPLCRLRKLFDYIGEPLARGCLKHQLLINFIDTNNAALEKQIQTEVAKPFLQIPLTPAFNSN